MLKLTYFMKVNEKMGLMSALLLGVFKAVIPFLGIFFLWIGFFATMSFILGSNQSLAEGYTGVSPALGYVL